MKKFHSLMLALSMIFTLSIPTSANPDKTNGYVPVKNTYGAVAVAEAIKQNGNTNLLNITVTIDDYVVASDSFVIANNSAGEFEVGSYKVYVSTYGNNKIDNIFITAINAAKQMTAEWLDGYLKASSSGTYSTYLWSDHSDNGEETGFWQAAGLYELLNDAYENTNDLIYKAYMDGYRARFLDGDFSWSKTWQQNYFSDDLLWWCNAFLRTYMLTDDVSYLTIAEEIFERVYTRAWDTRDTCPYTGISGGVLWKYDTSNNPAIKDNINGENEKNVATNGNAVIAAARFVQVYKVIGDIEASTRYANITEEIYTWMYEALVQDKTTGRLYDNYNYKEGVRDWQFSYNYGLFAGAAYEMWINTGEAKYLEHAKLVLNYGWTTLTIDDGLTFKDEGGMDGGDGAGFRAVFFRYTGQLIKDPEFSDFVIYMQANAYQAYHNRRASDGLIGSSLVTKPLDSVRIPSAVAAAGVVLQWYSGYDPNTTYGFEDKLRQVPAWGENGFYLAELATRSNVNFSYVYQEGSIGINHSVYWDDGGSASNLNGNSRYLEFVVEVSESGLYELDFRWFTRQDNTRRIRINDGYTQILYFTASEANVWEIMSYEAYLTAGKNTIRIWYSANDDSNGVRDTDQWLFLDYLKVGEKIGEYVEQPKPQYTEEVYTIDNATLSRVATVKSGDGEFRSGGLSSFHIWYWNNGGNGYVEFTVTVEKTSTYEMSFGWFTRGSDNVGRRLTINGENNGTIRFSSGGNVWTETSFEANLNAGTNTIRVSYDTSIDSETWLFLDHLKIKIPVN